MTKIRRNKERDKEEQRKLAEMWWQVSMESDNLQIDVANSCLGKRPVGASGDFKKCW